MDIVYLGHSSFSLKTRSVTVVTDPYDEKMVGISYPKLVADIVTVSHDHSDHNFISNVSDVKKVFSGPGEYEMLDVSFLGFPTYHDDNKGADRGKNTVFLVEIEGLRIAHLGDLGHTLSEKMVDELGEVDILFVPVGGVFTIDPDKALEVIRSIEPTIIIPMHYKVEGMNESFNGLKTLDEFITASGMTAEKMDKLSVKKELLGEDQRLICLNKK